MASAVPYYLDPPCWAPAFAGVGNMLCLPTLMRHGGPRNKSGVTRYPSFSSNAAAAAVSASCFDPPVALASAKVPIDAFTVKRGAWSGPDRSVTS